MEGIIAQGLAAEELDEAWTSCRWLPLLRWARRGHEARTSLLSARLTLSSPSPRLLSHLPSERMSYDPLANTPSTPIRSPAVPPSSPFLPNLSPLAPRSPLPGQLNGHYRPQPLPPPPSTSHWTSPPSNSHWTSPPASATSGSQRGMTPRSPQGYEEQGRRGDREERGGEGRPSPPDGFVRIKIMALEKNNRRDYYVKFNAEVSLTGPSSATRADEHAEQPPHFPSISLSRRLAFLHRVPAPRRSSRGEQSPVDRSCSSAGTDFGRDGGGGCPTGQERVSALGGEGDE